MTEELTGKDILITVSGPDQPGITAELMRIIAEHGDRVLDMGQNVTHGLLSLSIVVGIDSNGESIKDILFATNKMGLSLEYAVVDANKNNHGISNDKFILNCVAVNDINAKFIEDVSSILAKNNINILRIEKVSPGEFKSLEISTDVPDGLDMEKVKAELMFTSTQHQVDIAFLKDNVFRRSKRLIVFDMDSTLIQTEVIDEMADACGVGEEIREVTERAMNGEMDFNESLLARVSKLKGLSTNQMQEILDNLPLTQGVEEFIATIKSLGYKVALISGGFTFFAEALRERLGLDYAFANELEIEDGKLTGKVLGTIVNAEQKAMLLKLIAQQEKISMEQVVAIGDGANDLPMLSAAGLGIAFHAKEIVKKKAGQHMSHGPMTSILYFLGIPGPSNPN